MKVSKTEEVRYDLIGLTFDELVLLTAAVGISRPKQIRDFLDRVIPDAVLRTDENWLTDKEILDIGHSLYTTLRNSNWSFPVDRVLDRPY